MKNETVLNIVLMFLTAAGTVGALTAIVVALAGFVPGVLFGMGLGAFFGPWIAITCHKLLEWDREQRDFDEWVAAQSERDGLDDDQTYY